MHIRMWFSLQCVKPHYAKSHNRPLPNFKSNIIKVGNATIKEKENWRWADTQIKGVNESV